VRDFTLRVYNELLNTIKIGNYTFQTLEEFLTNPAKRVVILRHDSDIWPGNDLKMAEIEKEHGITATYYFRIPHTFDANIIKQIRDLGHEIGYHYENLVDANGDFKKAIESFKYNLLRLREIYPVKTVAMHGRPLSKWDSRLLWSKYNLLDFGLIGEPYLSIDYTSVFYLTDTGSRWDGGNVSIRDTVSNNYDHSIRTTFQLINNFKNNKLPDQILINAHAARWNDNLFIWVYRYLLQKTKNSAKYFFKLLKKKELLNGR